MPDELIDLLDEHGNKIGKTVMKSEAHQKCLWHSVIQLWIFTSKGDVILQIRANNVDFGGTLEISSSGHVGFGESPEGAAVREAKEEVGLNLNRKLLKKVGVIKSEPSFQGAGIFAHINHIFLYNLFSEPNLKNSSEVSGHRLISFQQLKKELLDVVLREKYVPNFALWEKSLDLVEKNI